MVDNMNNINKQLSVIQKHTEIEIESKAIIALFMFFTKKESLGDKIIKLFKL
jgi:hypothetical protein